MINPNELRIGNVVIYHGETDMPCRLDAEDIFNIATGYMGNDKLHSPMPITTEVLERLGWMKDWCGYSDKNGISFSITKYGKFLPCWQDRPFKKEIDHVHHLQNLYFALTGEELEVSELLNQ